MFMRIGYPGYGGHQFIDSRQSHGVQQSAGAIRCQLTPDLDF